MQFKLGVFDGVRRPELGANTGEAISQTSLQAAHRLPLKPIERIPIRVPLWDRRPTQSQTRSLIVAIRT
jgi:hypothetical protein